jgi:hypothetical protein
MIQYIKNIGRFSLVIDFFGFALPLNIDRYPGSHGWTVRIRFLCFNFHIRTQEDAEQFDGGFDDTGELDCVECGNLAQSNSFYCESCLNRFEADWIFEP